MNNISPNSYEAIVLFVVYICFQDGKVSDEEASELFLQSNIIKNFYFECFGEVCDLDIEQITLSMRNFVEKKFKNFEQDPSPDEIKFFNNLITDMKLRDMVLVVSKLSASRDSFHRLEEKKWNFWHKHWIKP